MACVDEMLSELEDDGWLVNQARMWLASDWSVRRGSPWQEGEDHFFRHLLDGSRAANRLGWQWVAGNATGRSYGFSRQQVERRAPELCARCPMADRCPISDWPPDPELHPIEAPALRAPGNVDATGPLTPITTGSPQAVWLTAESLGDADPALTAHPELPAVFVFDAPLLARLQLSAKRLVFLTETLADLATRRSVRVLRGDPVEELAGAPLAVTHAPVPGFRRRSRALEVASLHPWPWLVPPGGGSVASFSAWRKRAATPDAR
jgi:deoxyribodipyrimidine photo-lyase